MNPHISIWWIFVEQREPPLEVHQGLFVLVFGHHCNSEVSENRALEQRVSSLGQHDSDKCNVPLYSTNLVELRDLDLDLGLLLLLLKIFFEILV